MFLTSPASRKRGSFPPPLFAPCRGPTRHPTSQRSRGCVEAPKSRTRGAGEWQYHLRMGYLEWTASKNGAAGAGRTDKPHGTANVVEHLRERPCRRTDGWVRERKQLRYRPRKTQRCFPRTSARPGLRCCNYPPRQYRITKSECEAPLARHRVQMHQRMQPVKTDGCAVFETS